MRRRGQGGLELPARSLWARMGWWDAAAQLPMQSPGMAENLMLAPEAAMLLEHSQGSSCDSLLEGHGCPVRRRYHAGGNLESIWSLLSAFLFQLLFERLSLGPVRVAQCTGH